MRRNRKKYIPKYGARPKLPLSVDEQMRLVEASEGPTRTLLLLFLSTGMHPLCLAEPKRYGLAWDEDYVSWKRTKNFKQCTFRWSSAMKDELSSLHKLKGKTRQWYFMLVKDFGRANGVPSLCPLQLRHNYFINRARLGHNAFDIAHSSGTDLDIVYHHYTTGMNESSTLSPRNIDFLRWLMERS